MEAWRSVSTRHLVALGCVISDYEEPGSRLVRIIAEARMSAEGRCSSLAFVPEPVLRSGLRSHLPVVRLQPLGSAEPVCTHRSGLQRMTTSSAAEPRMFTSFLC